jgi:hypothetical protein
MNDSITKLDVEILNMESEEISGSELGALKYVSELLNWDIKKTANLFILILIFVFDPLAITLVIATNQSFKGLRKKSDNTKELSEDTVEELTTKQTPTNQPPSTIQVSQIWEKVNKLQEEGKLPKPTEEDILDEPTALAFTPYYNEEEENIEKNETPIDEYFERDDYSAQNSVENKEEIQEVIQQPRRISYLNRNNNDGKSIRINRF